MSGLETEEPILQPGRIDVLLGKGQTAQVLRNLCLLVWRASRDDWKKIVRLMARLFAVELDEPVETARGSIHLFYRQSNIQEPLEVAAAGRGLQQLLLIFAYLHSRRSAVLLIDEPDAHLEILRQRQAYGLLRDIAADNDSQVVLVTHSEAVLDEALDHNVTLLLGGTADNLAAKPDLRTPLTCYGAEHYVRALQHGYVLYVEGRKDLDILREFAERLGHPVRKRWDEPINAFYVGAGHPDPDLDVDLEDLDDMEGDFDADSERDEGGNGLVPKEHFFALRDLVPGLSGLAILGNADRELPDSDEGGLHIVYWQRYEAENYFITPELLRRCVAEHYGEGSFTRAAVKVLDALIRERIFDERGYAIWKRADADAARLLWDVSTEPVKLSDFAEEFFRRLGDRLGHPMLLRKGELHRLIRSADPTSIAHEVGEKLVLLTELLDRSTR